MFDTEQNNIDNTPAIEQDLDSFAAELFSQSNVEDVPAKDEQESEDESSEEVAQENEDEEENSGEENAPANEDDEEDGEEVDETPAPKKNRFQERIDEVVRKQREAERKAEQLEAELAKLKTATPQQEKKETPATNKAVDDNEPSPNAKNEDGTDKYPLGDFDPAYIRDLTKYVYNQEREAAQAEQAMEAERNKYLQQQAIVEKAWQEKLEPAKERYPDFIEKGQQLAETFEGIDSAYGEYLTNTLMSMEMGPEVLYYLANNVDEAQKIVDSGPTAATIALGKIEARLSKNDNDSPAPTKVSSAPVPPPRNKGTAVTRDPSEDLDNLDAFSKRLYNKKK